MPSSYFSPLAFPSTFELYVRRFREDPVHVPSGLRVRRRVFFLMKASARAARKRYGPYDPSCRPFSPKASLTFLMTLSPIPVNCLKVSRALSTLPAECRASRRVTAVSRISGQKTRDLPQGKGAVVSYSMTGPVFWAYSRLSAMYKPMRSGLSLR